MKVVYSLSDRQIDRLIRMVAIAIALLALGFAGFYARERYLQPNVSVADRDLQRLTDLVIKDPENPNNRINIATAFYAKEMYDEAIVQFNEALKLQPDSQAALIGLGLTYAQKKQDDKALTYLKTVVDMNKQSEFKTVDVRLNRVFYEMGRIYLNQGNLDEALDALNGALTVNKTDADSLELLGEISLKKGDLDRAEFSFKSAIAFVPDFTEAYQGLSTLYEQKGEKTQADYAKGMVALSKKDYDGAIRLLSVVIVADSKFASAYYGLGQAYESKGQIQKAYEAYSKGAELDPEGQKLAARSAKKLEILVK